MSRVVFSVLLPLVATPVLFLLAFILPVPWEPPLHPMWGWIVRGMGVSIVLLSAAGFLWPVLERHWGVLSCMFFAGLLVFSASWDLESTLWFISHLARVLLFLAGLALFVFGTRQAIIIEAEALPKGRAEGRREGRVEGYARGHAYGRDEGYDEGFTSGRVQGYGEGANQGREKGRAQGYTQGHAKGRAQGYDEGAKRGRDEGYEEGYIKGRADWVDDMQEVRDSGPFDPWRVLGLPPGSTQAAIRKAFREQIRQYHPDKVSHLGQELRVAADHKAKTINRAYEMLKRR